MGTYNLERFTEAQRQPVNGQQTALDEIRSGGKRGHWIWYVLPQLKALGRSEMSQYYGIANLDEAIAYLADDELETNLYEICGAILNSGVDDPVALMGSSLDATKLRSSMTLFELASPMNGKVNLVFSQILDKMFDGERDQTTLVLVGNEIVEF